MNLLVLHLPSNHIHIGFRRVACDERLLIEHHYSGHQWHVMPVCDVLFGKYATLCAKHDNLYNLSISQLTRVSKPFLAAVKQLEPSVLRCHRRERMMPYVMGMSL